MNSKHVLPGSVVERVKSPYPSTQDPGYAANLQILVKDLMGEPDSPLLAMLDRDWLQQAVEQDPTRMAVGTRSALDRAIDIGVWLDLYKPDLRL